MIYSDVIQNLLKNSTRIYVYYITLDYKILHSITEGFDIIDILGGGRRELDNKVKKIKIILFCQAHNSEN